MRMNVQLKRTMARLALLLGLIVCVGGIELLDSPVAEAGGICCWDCWTEFDYCRSVCIYQCNFVDPCMATCMNPCNTELNFCMTYCSFAYSP